MLVAEDGTVENRLVDIPVGLPSSALSEASNYLNARIRGRTLAEIQVEMRAALEAGRAELDGLTAQVVESGLATLCFRSFPPSEIPPRQIPLARIPP